MTYIADNMLNDDETILFSVNKTWFHYLPRIIPIYLVLGSFLALFLINPMDILEANYQLYSTIASILLLLVSTFFFFIQHRSEEYVVTENRIITKEGIFVNNIYEIQKKNVESIDIDQGIMARIFSYGTLEINGTGDEDRKVVNIAKPIEFRKAIGS